MDSRDWGPKCAHLSSMAGSPPSIAPRSRQRRPSRLRHGWSASLLGPHVVPQGFKMPPRRPKTSSRCSKTLHRRSKTPPTRLKIRPKRDFNGFGEPSWCQVGTKTPETRNT